MSAQAELPRYVTHAVIPVLNVTTAFLVAGLVVLAIGENPLEAVGILIDGALGRSEGIGFTLYYTTNFIFTGLAVAVAFQAGLFNIGGEGQAMLGGVGVAMVCLSLEGLPQVVLIVLAIGASAAFGAAWAVVPAWLQAKRGSHIVITTIMFNFLASALLMHLLVNVMGRPESMQPESRTFLDHARLPFIHDVLAHFGVTIPTSPLNLSFVLALLAAVFVFVLIWRTPLGFEIRTVGKSPPAARYAGVAPSRIIIVAMMISGGLAGFLGLNEIMGAQHRLILDFSGGYGFVGIAVALMGRSHPVGVVLAALLFGVLYQGGAELAFEKPQITRDMIVVIQGLVILFAGALEAMYAPMLAKLFAPALKGARA